MTTNVNDDIETCMCCLAMVKKLVLVEAFCLHLFFLCFSSDYLPFYVFLWPPVAPFHLFKQALSINSSEISFSQSSGVPKGINKSSQSF